MGQETDVIPRRERVQFAVIILEFLIHYPGSAPSAGGNTTTIKGRRYSQYIEVVDRSRLVNSCIAWNRSNRWNRSPARVTVDICMSTSDGRVVRKTYTITNERLPHTGDVGRATHVCG